MKELFIHRGVLPETISSRPKALKFLIATRYPVYTCTGVGGHFLFQGIFPTQGSNPGLPHHRQTLYRLSHQGSPYTSADVIKCQREKLLNENLDNTVNCLPNGLKEKGRER